MKHALRVYTARVTYAGADRFDVTRKTGGATGQPFAPSWNILAPALQARRTDGVSTDLYWPTFRRRYLAEMRESYKAHAGAWADLLKRERVVLVCYCVDPAHCHRAILRLEILPRLGAVDCGELQ